MAFKKQLKELLEEKNPFVIIRRINLKKSLKNTTPTFLCPNCIGGILFHDLGLRFQSPTVNIMMTQTDFIQFVLQLDYYLSQELVFFEKTGFECPCAHLADITVHFTHYSSATEAEEKWNERKKRINKENLFVFMAERDGVKQEDIANLSKIEAKGIVVFTANNYDDIPYAVPIYKYMNDGEVGNILKKNWLTGKREYEKYFDFVKWFNEANGSDYNVSKYCL